MPRYKLTIAYDGTDFCGWQKQEPPIGGDALKGAPPSMLRPDLDTTEPGRVALRTVQAIVEHAVRQVVREPVTLKGASRTDAGVHAGGRFPGGAPGGQVASFLTSERTPEGRGWPAERGVEPLVRAINSRLPDDVLVLDAKIVPDAFDPIADCVAKAYSYTICNSMTRPLWDRRTVFHDPRPLDAERMREGAALLVGERDFTSLAALNHGRQTAVREITSCTVHSEPLELGDGSRIRIDVAGNGFLYNMVRILAGTLCEVGRGRIEPGDIPGILEARDRTRAGPTLPPEGLRLEWIRYREGAEDLDAHLEHGGAP